MELLLDPAAWAALVIPTALEIVLGIDNVTFLSIWIDVALVGEAGDLRIPKGNIYFAMAFSVVVEMLNMRLRKRVAPVQLRRQIAKAGQEERHGNAL